MQVVKPIADIPDVLVQVVLNVLALVPAVQAEIFVEVQPQLPVQLPDYCLHRLLLVDLADLYCPLLPLDLIVMDSYFPRLL